MTQNYLDFVPIEILYQIYLYIDITVASMVLGSDLRSQNIHDSLLNDKLFFILKLNSEGMEKYIKYLGFTNSFINEFAHQNGMDISWYNDYALIHKTTNYIKKFIDRDGYLELIYTNLRLN